MPASRGSCLRSETPREVLLAVIAGAGIPTAQVCILDRAPNPRAGAYPSAATMCQLASLYWHFRWLGERRDWTQQEKALGRFAQLEDLGKQCHLI